MTGIQVICRLPGQISPTQNAISSVLTPVAKLSSVSFVPGSVRVLAKPAAPEYPSAPIGITIPLLPWVGASTVWVPLGPCACFHCSRAAPVSGAPTYRASTLALAQQRPLFLGEGQRRLGQERPVLAQQPCYLMRQQGVCRPQDPRVNPRFLRPGR